MQDGWDCVSKEVVGGVEQLDVRGDANVVGVAIDRMNRVVLPQLYRRFMQIASHVERRAAVHHQNLARVDPQVCWFGVEPKPQGPADDPQNFDPSRGRGPYCPRT